MKSPAMPAPILHLQKTRAKRGPKAGVWADTDQQLRTLMLVRLSPSTQTVLTSPETGVQPGKRSVGKISIRSRHAENGPYGPSVPQVQFTVCHCPPTCGEPPKIRLTNKHCGITDQRRSNTGI